MANTASARKRIRQTARRTERNQARKSRMRTFVKKVETAIDSGDKTQAAAALQAAQPETAACRRQGCDPPQHHRTQDLPHVQAHQGTGEPASEVRPASPAALRI